MWQIRKRLDVYKRQVYDGLRKIKFEKPRAKYKAEHEAELKQFYAARRKLTGEFPDGKVDMKKLSEEYDELEQAHNTTYGEFKTVRDDLHRLWTVSYTHLGHYGRLRKAYLEMHRPILFNELVLSDKLFEHCAEIDETARNRMELIVRSLAEQNGVTEQLKAENQMEWVRQMNACKAQAEAIVKFELIYD